MTPNGVLRQQDVYDAARHVESLAGNLTFEQAFALARLVLQHDGGPVPHKGAKAPIPPKISAVLERRGLVERGGDQEGRRLRVRSALGIGPDQSTWTATVSVADQGRIAAVLCASDEGIELVADAWRRRHGPASHVDSTPSERPELASVPAQRPEPEGLLAFDAAGRVRVPPLAYIIDATMCRYRPDASQDRLEPRYSVAICATIPYCDVPGCEQSARFDMPQRSRRQTTFPIWANMCAAHARAAGLRLLGSGRGTYLMHLNEIRSEQERAALEHLRLHDALALDENTATWTHTYQRLGFAPTDRGELERRSGTATAIVRHLGNGCVGVHLREAGTVYVPCPRPWFDAVVPDTWGPDLVRQVLVEVLGMTTVRSGGWSDLDLPLAEAMDVVHRGLKSGDTRTRLHEFADEPERFALTSPGESPFQRASRVVAECANDMGLLARLYQLHPHREIRAAILSRDDCPTDHLLAATKDVAQRETLLQRAALPGEVVEALFTALATSSSATEGRGRMLEAATHPLVPVTMVELFCERALGERDDRLAILDRAEDLDPERQAILRAAVLRRTRAGRTQDEVMTRLLGDQGVFNRPVMDWVREIAHHSTRMRASAWITKRVEATRAELSAEFERHVEDANTIASTFKVDADGRFNITRGDYEAYKFAVSEAKRIRGLLASLPASSGLAD